MSSGDDEPPEAGKNPPGEGQKPKSSVSPKEEDWMQVSPGSVRRVVSRRIAKRDAASDPDYDGEVASPSSSGTSKSPNSSQGADAEILKRRRDGRWMSFFAVSVMGSFVIGFFAIASCFAWRFFDLYLEHLRIVGHEGKQPVPGLDGLLPFVVPMMPAFFFSLLGLVTLITCTRFITSYVNSTNDDSDDANLIERIARSVAGVLRELKGGGS